MSFTTTLKNRRTLPFQELNCSNCPLNKLGFCAGAENLENYSMKHPSLIGCQSLERIHEYLQDVMKEYEPIPNSYHQESINLPSAIFGVTDGRLNLETFSDIPLFAVSMKVLLNDKGNLGFRDIYHLKQTLQLPKNAKLALIGTSFEKKQQMLWKNSHQTDIWQKIANFGFEWVTSTTFSVWDVNPRSDQIINQLRNYFVSDVMANLGIPTIPFVYPYDDFDYETFKLWIMKRPSIKTIAVLAQYYHSDRQYSQFIDNLKKIKECCNRDIHFLIVGVATKSKLEKTISNFENISIVSQSPYCEAMVKGKKYDKNLKSVQRLDIGRADLSYQNFKTFKEVIEEIRKGQNKLN